MSAAMLSLPCTTRSAAVLATIVGITALTTGCASPAPEPPPTSTKPERVPIASAAHIGPRLYLPSVHIKSVGEVRILLMEGLPPEVVRAFYLVSGPELLHRSIMNNLALARVLDPSSRQRMDIAVTGMRLRSTNSVFWIGNLGGRDRLRATITVWDGDSLLQRFQVYDEGMVGWLWSYTGNRGRFKRMADRIGASVRGQLR
jgi:hypothetical protein